MFQYNQHSINALGVCKKAYTQGVDIMLIVSKHAEGMSLRYDVIFTRHMLSCFGAPGLWG